MGICYLPFTATLENACILLGLLLCPVISSKPQNKCFCFVLSDFCPPFWPYHVPLPETELDFECKLSITLHVDLQSLLCHPHQTFPVLFISGDANILHNSPTMLSQNPKLFLAFLWCPYLELGSSKPLWYFYSCPSSGSSSWRYFCYQHSYKPLSELHDAWCSGCFFCQPEFLSNLSSGDMSVVPPAPAITALDFYQIWQKHRNSKDTVCLQVLWKWVI